MPLLLGWSVLGLVVQGGLTTVLRRLAISVAALNERLLLEGGTAYIIRLVLVLIWMEARLLVLHQVVQGRVVNHNTRVLPRKTLPYCHHS